MPFFTRVLLTLAITCCAAAPAIAQDYPSKPIKIIAAFGPGSASDLAGRAFAKFLQEKLKQAVVVENRAGANGLIGTEAIAQAAPDGYTLGIATNSTIAAAPLLYKKLGYDPLASFEHIGLFGTMASVAVVPPSSPFRTLSDLVGYAKANPGKLNFAFSDTSSRMPAELLAATAAIEIEGVPYKTVGNALTDVMGEQVHFMFVNYLSGKPHVAGGKLRALAVTELRRGKVFPAVPAVAETYPGFEAHGFLGLVAPKGTAKPILTRLNAALREAQQTPWFRELMENAGTALISTTPEQYQTFLGQEMTRWRDYARRAKIEPQ
jgi:tripartite-type tricarboxylate transporter receptor subunit TctC